MTDQPKSTFAWRVRAARPCAKKYDIWDDVISGLGLRVGTTGHRSFFLRRNVRGRVRSATIGNTETMSVSEVRAKARRLIATFIDTVKKDNEPRTPGHPDACIEDVDYRAPRRLDKALFQQLTRGQWITRKQNLIITGPCGVGKSWLACALGQKACRDDFSVLYKRIPRMFAELEMGRADGRYPRLFRALTRANLLILDDWGPDRLNPDQRRDLMEIVEDRYNNAAILVTSQLPLAKWHDVIGEPTFADAILDRIVHNAHRIDLVGPSMRKAIAENINANAIDHTEQK